MKQKKDKNFEKVSKATINNNTLLVEMNHCSVAKYRYTHAKKEGVLKQVLV